MRRVAPINGWYPDTIRKKSRLGYVSQPQKSKLSLNSKIAVHFFGVVGTAASSRLPI
jgi:hypothetical protein